MIYAQVSQGQIVAYRKFDADPGGGGLPAHDVIPAGVEIEALEGLVVTIEPDRVRRVWTARPKNTAERLSDVQAARRAAYSSIGDQLDGLFKARADDGAELAAIDAQIAAVKAAHPKPEA
jgi:hypothetical protein